MAKGNFPACLKVTLVHEGGWSDHPSDLGGATMKGVTIGRYRQYYPAATKAQLRAISDADLQRIYRNDYWNKVNGDALSHGVDLAVFDFGVNSGPSRASKYLQAVVGAKQDGVVGGDTLKKTVLAGGKYVIQKLCARRLSFVRGLKTWSVFGKGWGRRIADIEAKAVAMWLAKGGALTDLDRDELASEAKKAEDTAGKQNTGAGGVGAGGGGVGVVAEPNWIVVAVVAVAVVAAVVLVVKARQNKERAAAYAREAFA